MNLHRYARKIVVFITDYTFLTCSREEGKIFELEKRARTLNKSNAKTRLVDQTCTRLTFRALRVNPVCITARASNSAIGNRLRTLSQYFELSTTEMSFKFNPKLILNSCHRRGSLRLCLTMRRVIFNWTFYVRACPFHALRKLKWMFLCLFWSTSKP